MEKVSEIKRRLEQCPSEKLEEFAKSISEDERSSVKALAEKALKKHEKYIKERARLSAMLTYEEELYKRGQEFIAGVDEVGRGPLAGPVVACAVIMPKGLTIEGVNDSKKLSAKKREELYGIILEKAVAVGIGSASEKEIDEINILQATLSAMKTAIEKLDVKPEHILADAVTIPGVDIWQTAIIHGDAQSHSIACASIVAKVTRDRLMQELAKKYPEYGFDKNMGYGTAEHIAALKKHGACEIHRRTFIGNFV